MQSRQTITQYFRDNQMANHFISHLGLSPTEYFLWFASPSSNTWHTWTRKLEYIIQDNTGRSDVPAALSVSSFHLGVGPEDNPSPAHYNSVRFYGKIGLCCHGILTVTCWNKLNQYVCSPCLWYISRSSNICPVLGTASSVEFPMRESHIFVKTTMNIYLIN